LKVRKVRQLLPLALAALAAVPASAGPSIRTRDVCVVAPTGGGSFNTFVIRGVAPLGPGGAVPLQGLYFAGPQRVSPFHGSAVMTTAGSVRIGLFVHSTADGLNDFTVSGITDANFVGTVSFDNDGDFKPNGTLAMELRDCASITIP
jgi:hypothetical protein